MRHWLKWVLFSVSVLWVILSATPARTASKVDSSCSYKGVQLYGDVALVDSFPDVKVQQVDSFPDLNVQLVDSFPDACGKWKIVDSSPDFKIQYVDSFPDISIKMVDSFPGIP